MSKKPQIIKVNEAANIEHLASLRHSRNINEVHEESLSFGDKVADKMAGFAGSWTFILSFISVLILWIFLNSLEVIFRPFDQFPFILLNLVLSCVAAIQAPVIMMSQNRKEKKDRIKADYDYEINLKSEILIEEVLKRLSKLEANQNVLMDNQQKIMKIISDKKKI